MRPLILVTNDDGITSSGIKTLIDVAKEFGNVVVVAPDSPQSGMGHAITIGHPLRLEKANIFENVDAYECTGTPADCVKLAKNFVMENKKPDLVLSGINHGSNTSVSVLYSGTMSAAIEAAMEGIPAIGFSVCDYDHQADMSHAVPYIRQVITRVLEKGMKRGVALNVNFPKKTEESLKGIKVCRQAKAMWQEKFDLRHDPYGRRYFWMAGDFLNQDEGEDTDEWAVQNGYASIVPCQYDLTDYNYRDEIDNWGL
jgi:5'-nucleotidase